MKNNTKKILLSSVAATTLLSSVATADMLGAEIGAASWSSSLNGSVEKGVGAFDLESDLGYGSNKSNFFLWAYVDHPVPLIPNLKVQYTDFSDTSSGAIKKNITFDNKTFNASDVVSSDITLNQLDVIPYWRLLDNWVNFDLGVNFKVIDGEVSFSNTTNNVNQDLSAIIPMLYTKARFDLPFTGLSVEADGSYLGYSGNSIYDIKAGVVYESEIGLGATIGYRKENITIDDLSDVNAEINIEGIYAGIFYHF